MHHLPKYMGTQSGHPWGVEPVARQPCDLNSALFPLLLHMTQWQPVVFTFLLLQDFLGAVCSRGRCSHIISGFMASPYDRSVQCSYSRHGGVAHSNQSLSTFGCYEATPPPLRPKVYSSSQSSSSALITCHLGNVTARTRLPPHSSHCPCSPSPSPPPLTFMVLMASAPSRTPVTGSY